MLYHLVRPIARYVLRYYYRHLDLHGLENIPRRGPVIFAANHPTAFIEPCILACFQPRTLHFLARGDFFRKRFFSFLLSLVNILPVFRLKDGGYGKLKDNFSTFSACYRRLSKGGAIMILAEGRCIHEKRLRPLRKGTARIALGALVSDPALKDVTIIPVGVHFNQAERVRGQVLVEFGEPLPASEYLPAYEQNTNQGVNLLTDALHESLAALVVHVPDPAQDGLAEAVFELDRSAHQEQMRYGLSREGAQLPRLRALARGLPRVFAHPDSGDPPPADPDPYPPGYWIFRYFNRLQQFGLQDPALAGVYQADFRLGLWGWLQAIAALPILIFWAPIWWLAEFIAGNLIREVEFYSPLRFGIVAVGSLLYGLAWLIGSILIIDIFFPPFIDGFLLLGYFLVSLVGVRWAIASWERVWRWRAARRVWRLIPAERTYMRAARKAAVAELKEWGG